MKVKLIFSFIYLFLNLTVFSQDKILLQDGRIINGKIVEINPTYIQYKSDTSAQSPKYKILKKDINSLMYGNGLIDLVNATSDKKYNGSVIQQKNRLVVTYFAPYLGTTDVSRTFTTIGLWYERRIKANVSIKIPFEMNTVPNYQSFVIGFMPKIYFNKNKIIQGFFGPEILIGAGKGQHQVYKQTSPNGNWVAADIARPAIINTPNLNIGISINPVEQFNITTDIGIGAAIYNYLEKIPNTPKRDANFMFKLGLGMGYNF